MKNIKILIPIIYIVVAFSFPNKQDFSEAFIKVAKIGNPAVVSIVSEKSIESNYQNFFNPFGNQFPRDQFNGHSLGSGVIIDKNNGYILTNNHVIEDANEIKVVMLDKRELDAEIVATDPPSDIAVLKVTPKELITVKLGNSDNLSVGEWVIAIGSPFGLHLNHTVTAGIVSAVGRSSVMSRNSFEDFIQHDAAINPGNSGGALFNLNGELIGINTAIATDGYSRGNAGVGFAIPINMVKRVMEDLISDGKVTRGWLGVSIQDINESMAKHLKLKNRNGAIISQVMKNSPAQDGGIKEQDIIIAVNDQKVNDSSNLKNLISSGRPNDKTNITVIRDGYEKNLIVTLGLRPGEQELVESYRNGINQFDLLGLQVENYISEEGIFDEIQKGVRIKDIKSGSSVYGENIQKGDIIIEIGDIKVLDEYDYQSELEKYSKGDTIMLRVLRGTSPVYIAFDIK